MLRAVRTNASWKDDILAALSRGVVAKAIQELEAALEAAPHAVATLSLEWDGAAVQRYMTLLLAGFLEWHERMGCEAAGAWKKAALARFPGRQAFLC